MKIVDKRSKPAFEIDLTETALIDEIISPLNSGRRFYCGKILIDPKEIRELTITQTDRPSAELTKQKVVKYLNDFVGDGGKPIGYYITKYGTDVTKKYRNITINGGTTPDSQTINSDKKVTGVTAVSMTSPTLQKNNSKKVFIVHGSDLVHKLELVRFLETLGLEPIILHEQPSGGRTLIEKFEKYTDDVGYVFVLLTPDDEGGPRKEAHRPRARQNVILELGYFMGKLGRDRMCCLYQGDIEIPSDMLGIAYIKFENNVKECYIDVIKELKNAGYSISV